MQTLMTFFKDSKSLKTFYDNGALIQVVKCHAVQLPKNVSEF